VKELAKNIFRTFGIDIGWHRSRRSLEGFLQVLFEEYEINLAIDVGANTGQHAKTLRDLGFNGKIVSFEPIPATFAELSMNMKSDRNWSGYNCALGREAAEVKMIFDSVQTDMASLYTPSSAVPEILQRWAQSEKQEIKVQMETLDDQFGNCIANVKDPSIFLKCDTQGHDLDVLQGGLKALSHVRVVQIEVPIVHLYNGSPSFGAIVDTLNDMNFLPCAFFPVTTLGKNEITVLEFDCIAVRAPKKESACAREPGSTKSSIPGRGSRRTSMQSQPKLESLSQKLQRACQELRGEGRLREHHPDDAPKEIRIALLEADVNFKVVNQFTDSVRAKAVDQEVFQSLSPSQQVIKIVRDELVDMPGRLQGAGKSALAGKLPKWLGKSGRRPMPVSVDVYRPAAWKRDFGPSSSVGWGIGI